MPESFQRVPFQVLKGTASAALKSAVQDVAMRCGSWCQMPKVDLKFFGGVDYSRAYFTAFEDGCEGLKRGRLDSRLLDLHFNMAFPNAHNVDARYGNFNAVAGDQYVIHQCISPNS